jgi:hypothetical protein
MVALILPFRRRHGSARRIPDERQDGHPDMPLHLCLHQGHPEYVDLVDPALRAQFGSD